MLDVTLNPTGDRVVVTAAGELDHFSAGALRAALDTIATQPFRTVILDLSSLTFLDSTGLGIVIAESSRPGRAFLVLPGPEPVQRVFRTAGLLAHLPFAQDESDEENRPPSSAPG
jgi:anti-anti-sigma factor